MQRTMIKINNPIKDKSLEENIVAKKRKPNFKEKEDKKNNNQKSNQEIAQELDVNEVKKKANKQKNK